MNSIFEVNTKLSILDYWTIVENIAKEFITEDDGTYQPHVGRLNAMRLFYNYCVKKSKFDEIYKHAITNASDMEELVSDSEFIEEFNKAISNISFIEYNFGNAYNDALDIVNTNKTSIGRAVNIISAAANKIIDNLSSSLSEDKLQIVLAAIKENLGVTLNK